METVAEQGADLLETIAEFCRRAGVAESTFGRRAVNDGKFVARLRDGARITPETLQRVSDYLARHGTTAPSALGSRRFASAGEMPSLSSADAYTGIR